LLPPTNHDVTERSVVRLGRLSRGFDLGFMDSNPLRREFKNPQQSAVANGQSAIRMKLIGANPTAQIEGLDRLPGISNYFIGNDPTKWRTNHNAGWPKRRVEKGRKEVAVHFVIRNNRGIGVELSTYDITRALIIDPVIVYSSFLGGNHFEYA
jgi:hypothetical protein